MGYFLSIILLLNIYLKLVDIIHNFAFEMGVALGRLN